MASDPGRLNLRMTYVEDVPAEGVVGLEGLKMDAYTARYQAARFGFGLAGSSSAFGT